MVEMGRLALRVEGDYWVAYYAKPDTMEDAAILGSLAMRFAENEMYKKRFMALMRDAVGDLIAEVTGTRPEWPKPDGQPAPEHERHRWPDVQ